MTRLKSKITNPKSQINSKIQITKTKKSLPSPGACLREAASAKAGEGMEGRGMVRQAHHNHPEPVEGSPSPPAYRQAGNPLLSEPEAPLSRRPPRERGK
jgi:hypothetical protein